MRIQFRAFGLAVAGLVTSATLSQANGWTAPPMGPPTFPRAAVSTAGMVAAPGAASAVDPAGCTNCAPAVTTAAPVAAHSHPIASRLAIGPGCASDVGCSTYAAERTFFWGGCHQFFNPGNRCGFGHCGAPLGSGLFGKHDILPPGPGGLGNPNPCFYGSYHNR